MRPGLLKSLAEIWWADVSTNPELEWWQRLEQQRAAARYGRFVVITIVVFLAWGGYTLGRQAAPALALGHASVADRTAPKVAQPTIPRSAEYRPRTTMPLPFTSPVAVRGPAPTEQDGHLIKHPGFPFQLKVPKEIGLTCYVDEAPGAGSANHYELFCHSLGTSYSTYLMIAACANGCDATARAALRPPNISGPMTDFDQTTWIAEAEHDARYSLYMEHVWSAPPGILRPDDPAQTLYVAVAARAPAHDKIMAHQAVNLIRSHM